MPKLKDYHIEEYIFSFDHKLLDHVESCIFGYLTDRVTGLIKSDFKVGSHEIFKIDVDDQFFVDNTDEEYFYYVMSEISRDSYQFPGFYRYHYFLALDKNFKKELDKQKLGLLKMIESENFLTDLLALYDETFESLPAHATKKDLANFPKIFTDGWRPAIEELCEQHGDLPYHESLVYDLLIHRDKEFALLNIDRYVKQHLGYGMLHKNRIYILETIYYNKSYFNLETSISNDVSAKDFELLQFLAKYCQRKYLKVKNNAIRFDVDKFIKLKQLDLDQDLKDWQKADQIFNASNDDIPMIKPDDDRRRINIIKTLRKRGKQYLR